MRLSSLRRVRRTLMVAVLASGLILVARLASHAPEGSARSPSAPALACVVSLGLLWLAWRREHAASETESRARELQTLAMLRMHAELAKRKTARPSEPAAGAAREDESPPDAPGPGPNGTTLD